MTQGSQFGEQGVPSSSVPLANPKLLSHEKNHLLTSVGSLSEKGGVASWNLPREAVGMSQSASTNHLFLFVFRAIS